MLVKLDIIFFDKLHARRICALHHWIDEIDPWFRGHKTALFPILRCNNNTMQSQQQQQQHIKDKGF
jgi:hypothetical protein